MNNEPLVEFYVNVIVDTGLTIFLHRMDQWIVHCWIVDKPTVNCVQCTGYKILECLSSYIVEDNLYLSLE